MNDQTIIRFWLPLVRILATRGRVPVLALGLAAGWPGLAAAQQDSATAPERDTRPSAAAIQDGDGHTSIRTDAREASDEREQAAWEYRPYQVLVWLVHDHGAAVGALQQQLIGGLDRRCQLADSSAWQVTVQAAPRPWNGRLLSSDQFESWTSDIILAAQTVAGMQLDKLMIVRLDEQFGMIRSEVQELDLKTQLWGARIEQTCDTSRLDAAVFQGLRKAFMPLTRIDRISGLEVLARVRAAGIALVPETTDDGQLTMIPNVGSPVWIGDQEILLPVILRKDRLGNVSSIRPVANTFLSILGRAGPQLNCTTIAMQRAPLGGRSGGRTERVALCVRGPEQGTRLSLVSNEEPPEPLRDLEVYSRLPGQDEDQASEFLGKSDWQGQIWVPPHESGIRILYVKSGLRPLARVPVVPGLYPEWTARMPNDERRLYAEGIVKGYQNELFDLLARRLILGTLVESALARADLSTAEAKLAELRRVEDSKRFNTRLNLEKKGLLTADERQRGFIENMFDELEKLSNLHLDSQRVAELSKLVREAQKASQAAAN